MNRSRLSLVLGFLVAVVVAELLMQLLAPQLPAENDWPSADFQVKNAQLSAMEEPPELVIFGTSTSQAAIDPELLANTAGFGSGYNAAAPFSSPRTFLLLLEDLVLPNTSPSVVLIGLPPWAPGRADSDFLVESMRRAMESDDKQAIAEPALFQHRGVFADWDARHAHQNLLNSGLWNQDGHFTGYYERGPLRDPEWRPPPSDALDPADELALEELIDSVRVKGARPVLFVEPVCCHRDANRATRRYVDWLLRSAEDWDVTVWDTYTRDWPLDFYADESHFNRRGTEAFSVFLGNLLQGMPAGRNLAG